MCHVWLLFTVDVNMGKNQLLIQMWLPNSKQVLPLQQIFSMLSFILFTNLWVLLHYVFSFLFLLTKCFLPVCCLWLWYNIYFFYCSVHNNLIKSIDLLCVVVPCIGMLESMSECFNGWNKNLSVFPEA